MFAGLFLLILLILIPTIYRTLSTFVKSGFSVSNAKQYHNLAHFGVAVPTGYEIHGIDISHHQKNIEWAEVAAINVEGTCIHFAFIKATEGITRQDRHFSKNWQMSKQAGLIRGAYHFYYPTRNAKLQAENFIKQVDLEPGDLPPVLDIEVSKNKSKAEIVKGCREWCDIVEKHYGIQPIIYTNINFYNRYLKDDFEDYVLWIAHYYEDSPRMDHRSWSFWQHTDCAEITGIDKPVDFNVFNGSMKELKKLCIQ